MNDRFGGSSLPWVAQRGLLISAVFCCAAFWAALSAVPALGALPPGRGLEQVSPVQKNGGDAVIAGSQGLSGELAFSYASGSPGRVVYNSFGAFAGAPSGYLNQYLAERTATGWVSKPLTPRQGVPNFPDFTIGFTGFACDNCGTVIGSIPWPPDPEDENEVSDVYTTTGNLQWQRQSVGELPNTEGIAGLPIASRDGSVYTFVSPSPLTASATETEPGNRIAYFRTVGVTRPVAEKPDGKMLNAGGSWVGGADTGRTRNAIASDGYPIFFESPLTGGPRHVHARLENGEILQLDSSQCTGSCASQTANANWVGASPDGDIAYFTTDEQLLDSTPVVAGSPALYSYELDSGDLTFIAPSAGWTGDGAYTGFWGASDDGSRVYITSKEVLTSAPNGAGEIAELGAGNYNNTYLIEYDGAHPEGEVTFIGKGLEEGFDMASVSGVSPSGRYAMLWTTAEITPEYGGGTQQVYLFDALTSEAKCLSCGSSPLSVKGSETRPYGPTDSGRVLFSTPQALDPTDVNNKDDVYLHEGGVGGATFLLSGGQSEIRSEPVGMSRDGTDAYFATFARLLKTDIDGNKDVYDARVGGGFPEAVVEGECEGDGCSGAVSPPPATVIPGSSTYVGPPNRKAKRHKHKKKRGKHAHRRDHRHHIHRASRVHG